MVLAISGRRSVRPLFLFPIFPALGLSVGSAIGCRERDAAVFQSEATRESLKNSTSVRFMDITRASGMDFVHHASAGAPWQMPDIMGGGLAVFDYDNDGDLDIFLIDARQRSVVDRNVGNRLYRRAPDGRYVDATADAGFTAFTLSESAEPPRVGSPLGGMGCAIGDIDNDGDFDLYVTNYGADQLYRNSGEGAFEDITAASGIDNDEWGASALFVDYDRDGFLDLYVCNYLQYDPARRCTDDAGAPDYCGPQSFPDVHDKLFRNLGNGKFEDVSIASGVAKYAASGLGVALLDANRDGWPDVFVANDADANFLWINQRDGTFLEKAIEFGVALNALGKAEAGMGVVVGDVNHDGSLDMLLTHLSDETNTLYIDAANGFFDDRTAAARLADARLQYTGFGVAFLDFELDGDLDIAIANGAVERRRSALARDGAWKDYVEPNLLLVNDKGTFSPSNGDGATPFCDSLEVSRGLIAIDLDDDGDEDVIVTQIGGRARIYRNDTVRDGNFLAIRAIDPRLNRDAIGARVEIVTDSRTDVGIVSTAVGYLSARVPLLHFGLGAVAEYDAIRVIWPDGLCESFAGGKSNRRLQLMRGTGAACEAD